MIGKQVTVRNKTCRPLTWKVTKSIKEEETGEDVDFKEEAGAFGLNFKHTSKKFGQNELRN